MFASRIKTQLLLISLAPLLLVMLLVLGFLVGTTRDGIEEQVQNRGDEIAAQIVSMSEFFFYTGDMEKLSEVVELMINIDELISIKFSDAKGRILLARELDSVNQTIRTFRVAIRNQDPLVDELIELAATSEPATILGYLHIGISEDRITTQLQAFYIRTLLIGLVALLLGLVLAYLMSRKMTSALSSLAVTAREIELKSLTARCPENGHGELLELQHIFNEMAESLERNEQHMLRRIEEATRSLNASVDELSQKNEELAKQRQEAIELERSKAISDERARIMKDMHDGVGGQLVSSLAIIERESDSEARNNIAATLRECLDDFRLIINSLNVNANNLDAIMADFKYRLDKRIKSLSISLHWQIDPKADQITLQPQQALHLLRILQEATTNIIKHADATRISISLQSDGDGVQLMICDNGNCRLLGRHDYDASVSSEGYGLTNMQWRARQLKGTISFLNNEPSGLCVKLILPEFVIH
jgi:signal transduction histidine kinase